MKNYYFCDSCGFEEGACHCGDFVSTRPVPEGGESNRPTFTWQDYVNAGLVPCTVCLENGTVGTAPAGTKEGDFVTVSLHDENGNPITAIGTVLAVL